MHLTLKYIKVIQTQNQNEHFLQVFMSMCCLPPKPTNDSFCEHIYKPISWKLFQTSSYFKPHLAKQQSLYAPLRLVFLNLTGLPVQVLIDWQGKMHRKV